jgi:hypothetical protein
MKQLTPFVVSEFTNPSGKIVFQLYARIHGQRFRKNYQPRAEAEAERQVQEITWLQRNTGTRAAVTWLNKGSASPSGGNFPLEFTALLVVLPRFCAFELPATVKAKAACRLDLERGGA